MLLALLKRAGTALPVLLYVLALPRIRSLLQSSRASATLSVQAVKQTASLTTLQPYAEQAQTYAPCSMSKRML